MKLARIVVAVVASVLMAVGIGLGTTAAADTPGMTHNSIVPDMTHN
jgi:hypothetical protein